MLLKWIVLTLAVLMYALIVVFPRNKAFFALGTGLLFVVIGVVPPAQVLFSLINWNLLVLYSAALILSELVVYSGVPARFAHAAGNNRSTSSAVFIVVILASLLSAFTSAALLITAFTPVLLEATGTTGRKAKEQLTILILLCGIQGTAILTAGPQALLLSDFSRYTFIDFFVTRGKPSIFFITQAGLLAGGLFLYLHRGTDDTDTSLTMPVPKQSLSLVPSILLMLFIAGLTAGSFFFHMFTSSAAVFAAVVAGTGILWFFFHHNQSTEQTKNFLIGLNWRAPLYLAGIFVVAGGVAKTGLLEDFASVLAGSIGSNTPVVFLLLLGGSAIIAGLIDPLPIILVLIPVSAKLADDFSLSPELYLFALLIGATFGKGLTPFGSGESVSILRPLQKQGIYWTMSDWIRVSIPFTAVALTASAFFLWIQWR